MKRLKRLVANSCVAWSLTVFQVEVVGGTSRPQPHGVNRVVHVARDGSVIGHGQHHLSQNTVWIRTNRPQRVKVNITTPFLLGRSPECPPIWIHPSSSPPVRRSAQAACTQDEPSPRGFHDAANHPPPPPENQEMD